MRKTSKDTHHTLISKDKRNINTNIDVAKIDTNIS